MLIDVYISLPSWLSSVKPEPEDQVVMLRRECQVVLEIDLRSLPALPSQQVISWKSLVIPSTAGVKTEDYDSERDSLHLSVRVFGAGTKKEYNAVCTDCSKREGKKKGTPSLVDFHADSNVIEAPESGLVRVKFKFTCYPKHQHLDESAYL
jgi:hypothetical protein